MVLRGGYNSLKTVVDRVMVEAHDTNEYAAFDKVIKMLRDVGFSVDGVYVPSPNLTKKIIYAKRCK